MSSGPSSPARHAALEQLRALLPALEGDEPALRILGYALEQLEAAPDRYWTGAEFLDAVAQTRAEFASRGETFLDAELDEDLVEPPVTPPPPGVGCRP